MSSLLTRYTQSEIHPLAVLEELKENSSRFMRRLVAKINSTINHQSLQARIIWIYSWTYQIWKEQTGTDRAAKELVCLSFNYFQQYVLIRVARYISDLSRQNWCSQRIHHTGRNTLFRLQSGHSRVTLSYILSRSDLPICSTCIVRIS